MIAAHFLAKQVKATVLTLQKERIVQQMAISGSPQALTIWPVELPALMCAMDLQDIANLQDTVFLDLALRMEPVIVLDLVPGAAPQFTALMQIQVIIAQLCQGALLLQHLRA